jgi:regulatory protein
MSDAFESAREVALKFVDYQPRTCAEVRRRLARSGYESEIVEAVIENLVRVGFLNDERFSADWVENRSAKKGLGRIRLESELRRKGISADTSREAVGQIDRESELETALAVARKRLTEPESADPSEKRRLAAFLQRRGYNWETVQQVFEKLFSNIE